ncbi:hypothetical protein [Micromonospora sp. NBC_01813]|uniref:hypothetical protein n=1 Tax=Micromonospora sp. NBC_01813 TaxID=2975988 RepID=UPI002DDB040C|nr:hypothetical protein [Micromonospora sp. NBC_01813]WSA11585.1 sigma-70 region 4 domain-containing protein [Micromonospora sp. NBC_01813]
MSVGVPGSYRSLDWRGRYSPELVAVVLPTVWGHPPWLGRVQALDRCQRGAGKCGHICYLDQWNEGCTVDGDHRICSHRHGGHDQCGRCTCVSPYSRRSTDNREPDMHVQSLDVQRAYRALFANRDTVIAEALRLRHDSGFSHEEIAVIQGVSRQAVGLRLRAGHLAIADFLNGDRA